MNDKKRAFTHIDEASGYPTMVDVSGKAVTKRSATARCVILPGEEILKHLNSGDIDTKKGPVFQTAVIAGIMAAKKTSDLIPLCHPLALEDCKITINVNNAGEVVIECTAVITSKTGVEMEALTGATIAALTVYDMCKAFSHDIVIKETKLIAKSGGKGEYKRTET